MSLKRSFDVLASLAGLIILSPLLALAAVFVKADSRGPVFYRQTRVGKGGKDFQILKFRSMQNEPEKKGPLITVGEDARITRAGKLLRATKIDELPQLVNVLKGEMSLVGPRPEVRKYVDLYTDEEQQVLLVRPGITDPASIRYRNESEILAESQDPETTYINVIMPDKLRINLDYLKKRTLRSDIKVILKTIFH